MYSRWGIQVVVMIVQPVMIYGPVIILEVKVLFMRSPPSQGHVSIATMNYCNSSVHGVMYSIKFEILVKGSKTKHSSLRESYFIMARLLPAILLIKECCNELEDCNHRDCTS